MAFEQRPGQKELTMWGPGAGVLQAVGTACAKTLGWEPAWRGERQYGPVVMEVGALSARTKHLGFLLAVVESRGALWWRLT